MKIPKSENALVVRTDFSDQAAWKKICEMIRKPVGLFRFRANVEFFDDPTMDSLTASQVLALLPEQYEHTFIFVVDQDTIRHPEHPVLVVDLYDQPGRVFRSLPREIQGIENNLSIANMDFDEFASRVDNDGVFRGFPRSM